MDKKRFKVNVLFIIFLFIITVLLLIVVMFCTSAIVFAQDQGVRTNNNSSNTKLHKSIIAQFYDLQRKGTIYINKLLRKLRKGFDLKVFLIIIGFSFVYGIFHTLGPGHGKTIVASYFLQPHTTKFDALTLSVIISIIHTSTAIILALMFKTILSSLKGFARIKVQYYFTIASGAIVFILGVFYLILRILKKDEHNIVKVKGLESKNEMNEKKIIFKNILIGFSVGIVPCPLSMTIMMICFAYNILWVGFISVIALTFSMVILLYLIAIYTIKTRNGIAKAVGKKSKTMIFLQQFLGYTGNVLIILIGLYIMYRGYISAFPIH